MAESSSIVIGFDGGECAGRALDTAMDLARQFGDRLVIVFGAGPPGTPTEESREHRRAIEEIGQRVTSEAVDRAREGGVEADVVLAPERPSVALTKAAEDLGSRFIVVGSYGESPIRGAILGSVPHKLLQISETPVVVVRA
jgi:nucleotide-binding universal stress UspA family protein